MIKIHITEIRYRLGYYLITYVLSFLIILEKLPMIFNYSPYVFIHTRWDEAAVSFIIIGMIGALVYTFPIILYHVRQWMKPALVPREVTIMHSVMTYMLMMHIMWWMWVPSILMIIPTYFLELKIEVFNFTPRITDLASIFIDLGYCSIVIWVLPLLIYARISRALIYLSLVLVSTLFADTFSSILITAPLALMTEMSYYIIVWIKGFVKWKYSESQ